MKDKDINSSYTLGLSRFSGGRWCPWEREVERVDMLLCCQISDTLHPNSHSGTGTSPGVWLCNKPTDLSVCVIEERDHEGGVVVKLNSENRVSTGDVRTVSEK